MPIQMGPSSTVGPALEQKFTDPLLAVFLPPEILAVSASKVWAFNCDQLHVTEMEGQPSFLRAERPPPPTTVDWATSDQLNTRWNTANSGTDCLISSPITLCSLCHYPGSA